MNNVVFINNQEVFFENKDEQVFCTSLDVALVKYKDKKGELKTKRNFKSNNLHSKQYNLCFAR
ncbi:hypothetical protein ACMXCS_001666 [Campylobacter jejuni]